MRVTLIVTGVEWLNKLGSLLTWRITDSSMALKIPLQTEFIEVQPTTRCHWVLMTKEEATMYLTMKGMKISPCLLEDSHMISLQLFQAEEWCSKIDRMRIIRLNNPNLWLWLMDSRDNSLIGRQEMQGHKLITMQPKRNKDLLEELELFDFIIILLLICLA